MMYTSISLISLLTSVSPALAAPSHLLPRLAANTCDQFTPVTSGPFEVQNDAWGAIPGGKSCVQLEDGSGGSSLAWSSTFSWGGDKNAIKAYPNAQAAANTPCKPLNQYNTMLSSWSWSYGSTSMTGDVAYDAFLNPTCDGPGDPHTYEVMVWLAQLGGLNPISDGGDPASGIQLAGSSWKLYSGKNQQTGTQVFSFAADTQINDFSGDLMEFFDYLVKSEGVDAGLKMTSMQAGTEVSVGEGTFTTSKFSITST
ncbi:MAG: hypothetical protein LQ338_007784 [Usnochroma carphineum]|nr:MAG: hypothetical protein LQ338_007784 [Usnochroma carphineum]